MSRLLWFLPLLSFLRVSHSFDPSMGGSMGVDAVCPLYRCGQPKKGKGKVAVPGRILKFRSNGCQSGEGAMMMNLGDKEDKGLTRCCDQRNACMQVCGMRKQKCEELFKGCQLLHCASLGGGADTDGCKSTAGLHVMMQQLGGCKDYNAAQGKACSCMTDGPRAEERRVEALTGFYQKYNPDKVDQAKALATKKSTTGKFAALLNKLVVKYPACIKRAKKGKAKSRMEDIMSKLNGEGEQNSESGGARSGSKESESEAAEEEQERETTRRESRSTPPRRAAPRREEEGEEEEEMDLDAMDEGGEGEHTEL